MLCCTCYHTPFEKWPDQAMEEFCNGSPVWNSTLTWQGSWPEFTPCFQQTVLVWGCCGLLWLSSLLYLPHLLSLPSHPQPLSSKHVAKLAGCGLITLCCAVDLVHAILERPSGAPASQYLQSDVWAPVFYLATMMLATVMTILEKKKDFTISPVLFVFWVVLLIVNVVPLYSKIILKTFEEDVVDFISFCFFYVAIVIEVVVHCLTETRAAPVHEDEKPCLEANASILSRITFQWINGLVRQGFRQPLTDEDIHSLHPRDQPAQVFPKFLRHWNRRVRSKHLKQTGNRPTISVNDPDMDADETTPLLLPATRTTPDSLRRRGNKGKESRQRHQPSLLLTLCRCYGPEMLLSQGWVLCYSLLILSGPLLLGWLVGFVQDRAAPAWHGYVIALGLLLSSGLRSVFDHQQMQETSRVGVRIKAALLSAIYRKSLKMSNDARKESTVGETVTVMSVDVFNIALVIPWLWCLWSCPLLIGLSLYLLYSSLGASMFAGLALLVLLLPLNAVVMTRLGKLQDRLMSFKDKRMKIINEVLGGIKILKLYAWEPPFQQRVSNVRDQELGVLWHSSLLSSAMLFSWTVTPFLVGLLTFLAFVLVESHHWLSPALAFVSVAYFNILRTAINLLPVIFSAALKAVISVGRINKFLNREELDENVVNRHGRDDDAVVVEDGTFAWGKDSEPTLHNVDIQVPRGKLVAVVGVVGSGKSSLLSAFLGDMEKRQGQVFLEGSMAYVPQQAWIQNARLKDNVVFGRTLEEGRYQEVLEACALGPDLAVLPAGDLTEIGERGINLSGGQKQRVSLARAVYSQADVFLLDDPLSAVDSHVGKHIFRNVLGESGLLRGKTRVLVTHGVHWLPQVDKIFVLHKGRVRESGTYSELISHNGPFAKFLATYFAQGSKDEDGGSEEEDKEVLEMKKQIRKRLESVVSDEVDIDSEMADKKPAEKRGTTESAADVTAEATEKQSQVTAKQKLIEEEKVETGSVSLAVFLTYIRALGLTGFSVAAAAYGLFQAAAVVTNIWLSSWTDDSDLANFTLLPANSSDRRERNDYYLEVYGGLGVAQVVMIGLYTVVFRLGAVKASRVLHGRMLACVLRAPMAFFDTTPQGRLLTRFSSDMDAVDTSLPNILEVFLDAASMVLASFVVISYSTPIFIVVIVPVVAIYFFLQRYYVATSRQLQRLEARSRSPVINHFSETLAGVSVVRAYREQARFIAEFERRVDRNLRISFTSLATNRWIGLRLEQLANLVVFMAAVLAVVARGSISAGIVGLSISYALQVTENLTFLVRMTCNLETQAVAVERVKEYSELQSEDEWDKGRELLPPDWPQQGHIQFQEYSCRYRPGLELVLHTLSCDVRPGEKVGIVGRTGAGKSSLTLSLFRLIEPASGRICIDSLDICSLGLHQLREHLTILPQDPVLFAGTLRMNLDPFDQYSDTEVWTALEHAHLKSFVWELPARLQHLCGEGGENLSVGQRQLLCLARTLLRKTRILVFDEATAAVDLETDDLIQQTIRSEFKDCTVLTIAHRLNTVMDYNRILVLDNGRVAEFDTPTNLLSRKDGIFSGMAKDANLI